MEPGKGRYVVREGRELLEFSHWDDVPQEFDNLVSFRPEYPPGPHSDHEHEGMSLFNEKLRELMRRERRGRCRQSPA